MGTQVAERRNKAMLGLSPMNMVLLASMFGGLAGTWFVMQDDIKDLEKDVDELKETNNSQWRNQSEHIIGGHPK